MVEMDARQNGEARGGRPGEPRSEKSARPRAAYRAPRLERYGKLAEVTHFGGSQMVDSGGNLGNIP
jgi:hypothetical protein